MNLINQKVRQYGFVIPGIIVLLLITIFPLVYSLIISFYHWQLTFIGPRTFAGLSNYADILLKNERFWDSLYKTFSIAVPAVILQFVIGLGLALLLSTGMRGKRVITALLILPIMIPPITTGLIWRMLYHEKYGAINGILRIIGLNAQISWLGDPRVATFSVILTDVWQWTPFVMMILLAGLQSISVELYESAEVDGASVFQRFKYITLPLLAFPIMVAVLLRVIDLVKLFDIIFVLTRGGPGGTTETISMYTYLVSFRHFRVGYGSALSYLLLVISVIFSMALIRLIRGKKV